MSNLEDLRSAVERGKKKLALPALQACLDEGVDPQVILDEGLIAAMDVVGDKFSKNEVFVPEMLVAARTMAACTDVLKPILAGTGGGTSLGKAVIGTVAGDMHEMGKNLVGIMMQGRGIDVTDLGVNVPADRFVAHVRSDENCNLVLLSAFRTESRPQVKAVIDALRKEKLRDRVFVMIGGPACDMDMVGRVGADAYTRDAVEAADVAVEFLRY